MPIQRKKETGRLLGIDFGLKRVGIALSDEDQKIAFPKIVYPNDKKLLGLIADYCEENSVVGIALGESKNFKGEDNPIMKDILKFNAEIEKAASLPVYMNSEFMTSSEEKKMRDEDDSGEMIDASAAAVILQSYLDRNRKMK